MNEKILRLALDAGLLNYVDNETPRRYFISAHAEIEDVKKFAELIVRECINALPDQTEPVVDTAKRIKAHFGVQ